MFVFMLLFLQLISRKLDLGAPKYGIRYLLTHVGMLIYMEFSIECIYSFDAGRLYADLLVSSTSFLVRSRQVNLLSIPFSYYQTFRYPKKLIQTYSVFPQQVMHFSFTLFVFGILFLLV